ncbi:MAG: hypothetical protein FWD65_03075 [Coriobacteriia bacterium]|nr:hypothetical protein [Coriobacteriia bacterium]
MKKKSNKKTLLLVALLILVALPLLAGVSIGVAGYFQQRTTEAPEQEKEPIPIKPSRELICTKENPNHQEILNYIKEINPDFDIKTCIIDDPDWDNQPQPQTMGIGEAVDGFNTKSGYVIFISDGKVDTIYDDIVEFDKNVKAPKFNEASVVKKAKKKAIGWNRDKVVKQEIVKWYDIDKKQFSIDVGTIFVDSTGDKYGADYVYVLK